jgi:hypothetical protein
MKAWQELESDPNVSLWWYGDERNPTSYYYIDHGVRISKDLESGLIEVKNASLADEHYVEVSTEQYDVFAYKGWLPGCYRVCIDTLSNRINKVSYLMSIEKSYDKNEELRDRLKKLLTKLERYLELNEKLSTFATTKK